VSYICADCEHEQDSMTRACDDCGSIRVVLASIYGHKQGGEPRPPACPVPLTEEEIVELYPPAFVERLRGGQS
jgi:hypothetical protein